MTTAIDPSLFANTPDTTTTAGARQSLSDDFDSFLVLLTTQLQNQDPLDPMDSTEFTNQLVQFASVEQQLAQTEELETQTEILRFNQTNTALGYIGLEVELKNRDFRYEDGAVNFTVEMPEPSEQATIFLLDEAGRSVFQTTTPLAQGSRIFTWDGTLPDGSQAPPGTYTVEVAAEDEEGNRINATTYVPGRVDGVQTINDETELVIGELAVPLRDVRVAIDPDAFARVTGGNDLPPPTDP